jgi:hypothetical protein
VNWSGRSKFITTLSKSTSTIRHQSQVEAPDAKKILCKIDLQMCDEYFFMIDGNEWQQQSYYESEDHPATGNVKFMRMTKFPSEGFLVAGCQ